MNPKKATTNNKIPPKILQKLPNLSASFLHKLFNESIENNVFPQSLKLTGITQVHKRNNPIEKANHRPDSALPVALNNFARITQKQNNGFIDNLFSTYLCGHKKGFDMY